MLRTLLHARAPAPVHLARAASSAAAAPSASTKARTGGVWAAKAGNPAGAVPNADGNFVATLFPGDGIGPEIAVAVRTIFKAASVPIEWEHHVISTHAVTPGGDLISAEALDSVVRNRVGLKVRRIRVAVGWGPCATAHPNAHPPTPLQGPFATPIGKGHKSLNLTLRKALSLYANVRPCKSIVGFPTKYSNVDIVTIRENTEGEYTGIEHEVVPGVVENLKVITKTACDRIAEYAFKYAAAQGRKTVTAVHKATIHKLGDGLFLECCRAAAKKYPTLKYEEMVIDSAMLHMASDPTRLDLMVMPNLYGDIASDLAAGLIGGLGLTPSGNIGETASVFEAVHGTAPDIAGRNKANPTALLLSGVMMLRHLGLSAHATLIEDACLATIAAGPRTGDLGGTATTTEFTAAIIKRMG